MAELKTKKTNASVKEFIAQIPDEQKRKDCLVLIKLIERLTKSKAKIWGTSIIGFGDYHYVSTSGREGDWFKCGIAPRKTNITIYLMAGAAKSKDLLSKLGKHKLGGGCLYIKRLSDVDLIVLEEMIKRAISVLP